MSYEQQDVLRRFNIYINSSQRSEGTPSNFTIQLPSQIVLNNIVPSKFDICIDRAQIPLSFSQFSDEARSTQLEWSCGSHTGTAMIPYGNYDVKTLSLQVAQTVRNSIISVSSGSLQPVLSFQYNLEQNRYRIYLTGVTSITFDVSGYPGLSLALGFSSNWTLLQNQYTISTQDVCVSPSRSLYITSNTLVQEESYEAITSPFRQTSVLAMVPIVHTPLLFLTHAPPRPVITRLSNSVINDIQLTLRDEQSEEIYEMDLDWSCHISIAEVRVDPLLDMQRIEGFRLDNIEMFQRFRSDQEKRLLAAREKESKLVSDLKQKVIDKLVKDQERLKAKQLKEEKKLASKKHKTISQSSIKDDLQPPQA